MRTPVPRIVAALRALARVMGHTVSEERIAVTALDLSPYDEALIAAAIEHHRKTSRFFPQSSELLALVDPGRYGAERRRMPLWGERTACPHVPACRTITECRDLILEDVADARRDDIRRLA